MFLDVSSFSARLRTAYATLIFLINFIQVILHMINLLFTPILFPLYQSGWALVIVRLFEFRSELEAPRTPQPFATLDNSRPQLQSVASVRRIPNAPGIHLCRQPSLGHVASRFQRQPHRLG
ncbi:hypothetical protein BCR44DRAFT_1424807 [Catenaria anguillulae PL171]|uniref:Uncharacterized protein n=1 Tax=Catenaria anguillulae PL171 TaxID=765915 RepID=A0A1Y2I2Y4_9FUNG|nr:hypothetical protein BCR44DRAFT_1424807 [Catenaria anguillulae PL171]